MPTFAYQGTTRQGSLRRGEVEAADRSAACLALRQREVFVTRLRETSVVRAARRPFPALTQARVSPKELVVFTWQLEAMIKAGVPLSRSLEMLAAQTSSSAFRAVVRAVTQRVEDGSSLAGALREHPAVFTPWYAGMVEAGEEGGRLGDTFRRLAEQTDTMWRLRQQVRLALVYPLFVSMVAALVFWALLVWVIPMFGAMFAEWDTGLPWPTALVLAASQSLREHWVAVLAGVAGLGLGMRWWAATPSGRRLAERALLRVPALGTLWRNVAVVNVTRTLGSLLGSGVPMLRSLELAQRVAGVRAVERALAEAAASVREGQPLADPLARSGAFPELVSDMVAVGETTGSLDEALGKIADLYAREVDRDLAALTALLEPLIIVALGLGIGFLVVAMYLPIFMMGAVAG